MRKIATQKADTIAKRWQVRRRDTPTFFALQSTVWDNIYQENETVSNTPRIARKG